MQPLETSAGPVRPEAPYPNLPSGSNQPPQMHVQGHQQEGMVPNVDRANPNLVPKSKNSTPAVHYQQHYTVPHVDKREPLSNTEKEKGCNWPRFFMFYIVVQTSIFGFIIVNMMTSSQYWDLMMDEEYNYSEILSLTNDTSSFLSYIDYLLMAYYASFVLAIWHGIVFFTLFFVRRKEYFMLLIAINIPSTFFIGIVTILFKANSFSSILSQAVDGYESPFCEIGEVACGLVIDGNPNSIFAWLILQTVSLCLAIWAFFIMKNKTPFSKTTEVPISSVVVN